MKKIILSNISESLINSMYEFLVYPYRSVVYEPYMVGQLSNNELNFRSSISILALTGALLHLFLSSIYRVLILCTQPNVTK